VVIFFFYFLLAFLLPFLWIIYFYKKDKHPENYWWLFLAFILGIIAGSLSYFFEKLIYPYIFQNFIIKSFLFALIEEFFKFFLIFLIIFSQKKIFDEYIDAMIYMSFSALGFAFLENLILVMKLDHIEILPILFLRFISANLLHILVSSLIGFGYAISLKFKKYLLFPIIFIIASFLHFIYNYFIIKITFGFIFILIILFLLFMVVIKEFDYLNQNE